MAVKIVKDDERYQAELEGSTFHYRRTPSHIRAEILQRNTPRRGGDPNWEKVMLDLLRHGLLDWENVTDENGQDVPFSKDLIPYLPQNTQVDLLDKLGANVDQLKAELGN